jgi:HEAT repeat protein
VPLFVAAVLVTLLADVCALAESRLTVECEPDRLAVVAERVALTEVLADVARCTGLRVRIRGTLPHDNVSVRFSSLPLREALGRLLRNVTDYVIVEDTTPGSERVTVVFWRKEAPRRAGVVLDGGDSEGLAPRDIGGRLDALRAAYRDSDERRLWEAVSDGNALVQATAVELLRTRNAQAATAALLERLKSPDGDARLQALHLLAETTVSDDRPSVLSALESALTDDDVSVKRYAIQTLASSGSGAVRTLDKALRDPDPSVRMTVVENAAQMHDGRPLLVAALADPNPDVRALAKLWLRQVALEGR